MAGFLLFVARGGLHGGAAPVVDEAVASALPRAGQVRPGAAPAGDSLCPTVSRLTGAWRFHGSHWTVTGHISWARAKRRAAAACGNGQKR